MNEIKPKKVVVAMSGGVDSSIAAALLKRAGFSVSGVFMRLQSSGFSEAEKRAKLVAKKLNIPFHVLNFEKEFKKKIIDYFLKEYKAGRTPNPCVVCNKEIKFGLLLKKISNLKADYTTTGHYVIFRNNKLFKAKYADKDQSYFLWQLSQKQLKRALFPIGSYSKTEIKNLAKKFKLPLFAVPESQEICFIRGTVNDFLARRIKLKPGPITFFRAGHFVFPRRKHNPKHQGLPLYTIGQRKGIGLSGGPYWVLDKDLKKNELIITKNEKDLFSKELVFKKANWISGKAPAFPLRIKAKIRYRSKPAAAFLRPGRVVFDRPQRAVTPGQSVVFYKGKEVIGGAFIFSSKSSKI